MVHERWQRAVAAPHPGCRQGYATFDFVDLMRELGTAPHVTRNLTGPGGSAIDRRTTRRDGYAKSQHAQLGSNRRPGGRRPSPG